MHPFSLDASFPSSSSFAVNCHFFAPQSRRLARSRPRNPLISCGNQLDPFILGDKLSASVQPLLAHTSLSHHPIFTSSVYTLATASKSASPLLLPWTPATASSEHTEDGAACSRRRTRRGEDGPATFQRGRRSPGFRRFFLVTCPPVSDSGPV